MPTVFTSGRYRFFFYSNEGDEPPHVHVEAAEKRAKFWLIPIELCWYDGFRSGELKDVQEILTVNLNVALERWNEHFGL